MAVSTTPNHRQEIFGMMLPGKAPVAVPANLDFSSDLVNELDLSFAIDQGWVDFISGIYIYNPTDQIITIEVMGGTYQKLDFPALSGGYVPLLFSNPPKVKISVQNVAAEIVKCLFYNVPMIPYIYSIAVQAGSAVDIASIGGTPLTGDFLPVQSTPVTWTEYTLVMAGGDETPVAAGGAARGLQIQNPTGNGPVTINIAGNDASVSGFELQGGGSANFDAGVANEIHVAGTNGETLVIFGGA